LRKIEKRERERLRKRKRERKEKREKREEREKGGRKCLRRRGTARAAVSAVIRVSACCSFISHTLACISIKKLNLILNSKDIANF